MYDTFQIKCKEILVTCFKALAYSLREGNYEIISSSTASLHTEDRTRYLPNKKRSDVHSTLAYGNFYIIYYIYLLHPYFVSCQLYQFIT
jgi:hypothetical protein